MKGLLLERFLPSDYEQHLYGMYLNCSQGVRTIHEYTSEFMRLAERNNLKETDSQHVARYLRGLRSSIRDRMGLHPVFNIHQAQRMALRAKEFERCNGGTGGNNFRRLSHTPHNKLTKEKESLQFMLPQHLRCDLRWHR